MGETSVEQSPDFYTAILDALPLTLAVIDQDGVIVETNGQWQQFGLNNDIDPSYLESGVNYLDICERGDDEFAEKAYRGLSDILAGESDEFTLEYPCHGDEENRWFLMKARPLGGRSGNYVLIVHLDITQRVVSERKLRHKEKLASIGEMSAGIMHEINNPNSFIEGNVDYLLKRLDNVASPSASEGTAEEYEDLFEELEPILREIKSGSRRITRIVNKVEGFSRKHTADESETSVDTIDESIRRTVEQVRDERDVEFVHYEQQLDEASRYRSVLLSEDEFKSIVKNLLNNAVTAVEDDTTDNPAVYLESFVEDATLHLYVMDNGVGIEEEALSKVKDPFYTTKSISEGTGLGLSIVSNLIKKADGEFDVFSEPGEGTWTVVTVPLIPAE